MNLRIFGIFGFEQSFGRAVVSRVLIPRVGAKAGILTRESSRATVQKNLEQHSNPIMERDSGQSAQSRMPGLIIFGVDGGAFEILRPLMAYVPLPNFARVMERGGWRTGLDLSVHDFPAFTINMTRQESGLPRRIRLLQVYHRTLSRALCQRQFSAQPHAAADGKRGPTPSCGDRISGHLFDRANQRRHD